MFYINAFLITFYFHDIKWVILHERTLQSGDPDIQHWTWGTEECTGLFSPYNVTNIAADSE